MNHENCVNRNVPLPSRLLDLGRLSDWKEIRLQKTGGAQGHHAALSHSWGRSGHFTTSRDSIAARKEGIKIGELPRTSRDAVEIVKRLGLRYLWIDSLCLCQVDVEDWARESAKMAAVYSNSFITIAADGAKDNSEGLFSRRSVRRHVPVRLSSHNGSSISLLTFLLSSNKEAFSWRYVEMWGEPLSERAWALQERLLPKRVLH